MKARAPPSSKIGQATKSILMSRSVAMLVMHFGHRDPEMHSHDATSYYAAIRPASAASHPYAVRHSFHNDFTPGCVACFARPAPGYRGLLDLAFGSPCLVDGDERRGSLFAGPG